MNKQVVDDFNKYYDFVKNNPDISAYLTNITVLNVIKEMLESVLKEEK